MQLVPDQHPMPCSAAQGNEFSYYMLLTSAFMLNHTTDTEQWTVYPWALSSCNQLSDADQLRPVRIPSTPFFCWGAFRMCLLLLGMLYQYHTLKECRHKQRRKRRW